MTGATPAVTTGTSAVSIFARFFRGFLGDKLMQESALAAEQDCVEIDALVTPRAADRALYEDFQRLTPFGPGNPEPLFAVADGVVEQPRGLRGGHVFSAFSLVGLAAGAYVGTRITPDVLPGGSTST